MVILSASSAPSIARPETAIFWTKDWAETAGSLKMRKSTYLVLVVALPQLANMPVNRKSDRFEDAKEYYDFLYNKKMVRFHAHTSRSDPNEFPPFELVLNSRINYDQLSEKVANHLGVEPTHIRFYTVNSTTGNPRGPVKRSPTATLHAILNPNGYSTLNMNQRNDALYFEVLDMSLAELDTKKNVKITFLSEGITKEVSNIGPLRLLES